jgi:hypothetical protein
MTLDLAARDNLTFAQARALAVREGATHSLRVAFDTTTFYRTHGGRVEVATALADGARWTLSTWVGRVLNTVPQGAALMGGDHDHNARH